MKKQFPALFLSLSLLVGLLSAFSVSAASANPAIKLDFVNYAVHGGAESTAVLGEDLSVKVTNANAGDGGIRKEFSLAKIDLAKTPYLYFDIAGSDASGVTLMVAASNALNGTGGDWSMEQNLIAWTPLTTDGVKKAIKISDLTALKLDNGGNLIIQLRFSGVATTVTFNGVYFSDEEFVYEGATYDGTTLQDGTPLSDNPAVKLDFTNAEIRSDVTYSVGENLSVTINCKDASADYLGIVKTFLMEGIDLSKTPIVRFEIEGCTTGVTLMIDISNSLNGTEGDWSRTCEALRWKALPADGTTLTVDLRDHPQLKLNEGGDLTIALLVTNETDDYTDDGLRQDIVFKGVYLSDEKFVYEGAVYGGEKTDEPDTPPVDSSDVPSSDSGSSSTTSSEESNPPVNTGVSVTPVLMAALLAVLMVAVLAALSAGRKGHNA